MIGQLDEALAWRELSWRNVFSGIEDAMQDLPPLFHSGTLGRHSGRWRQERRGPPGSETFEDPGPHHHLRGCERASRPASDARAGRLQGGPARDCRNLGMLRLITRGCGAWIMVR